MEPVVSLPKPRNETHHRADNRYLRSSVQKTHRALSSIFKFSQHEFARGFLTHSEFVQVLAQQDGCSHVSSVFVDKSGNTSRLLLYSFPGRRVAHLPSLLVPSEFLCYTLCFLSSCFWITSLGCGANLGQMGRPELGSGSLSSRHLPVTPLSSLGSWERIGLSSPWCHLVDLEELAL